MKRNDYFGSIARQFAVVAVILLLWGTMSAVAQTQLQVVTKTIEKELPYTEGQPILINAQKADVIVRGWNRQTVAVRLRLITKNPDRTIAEQEAAYHVYTLQSTRKGLELANRFAIPHTAGRVRSQLKAVFEVQVPTKALLTINNRFGDITLSDLTGETTLLFEFGKLWITSIQGKLSLQSDYGDIEGQDVNATLFCKTQKATVLIRNLGGTATLKCQYGELTVVPAANMLDVLTINSIGTDVVIMPRRVDDYQYEVESAYNSAVAVPMAYRGYLSSRMGKQRFFYQPSAQKPLIKINSDYAKSVTIKTLAEGDMSAGK